MPGPIWQEERPSWCTSSILPKGNRHAEDVLHVVRLPSVVPSAPSLEEFANRSTLHGLSHIFHGRYTARNFLWTVAFLSSFVFLIHVYAERVTFYFQYPHDTTLEEVNFYSMIFPAITICNINPLRFSQLSGHDLYWAGEFLGFLDSDDKVAAPEKVDAEILEILNRKLMQSKRERNLPFNFRELHDRAGHQIEDMLVECKFANESCSPKDFTTVSLWLLL